jgi:hypothetical protein
MGDNKPPLFELLNFALGAFPNHGLVFLLATGLANGIVALLLWRLLAKEYGDWYGLMAAGVWLLSLSLRNGTHINVRSLALVGLLSSLLVSRAIWRGVAIGVAGLFSQYAVLFIPVLAWDSIRNLDDKSRLEWLLSFGAGGLATLLIAFGAVGIIWGPRASLAGFYWSYGIPTGVTTTGFATDPGSYLTEPWVLTQPLQWGGFILHYGRLVSPMILLSVVRGRSIVLKQEWDIDLIGAAVLFVPLLVRSYAAYWLLALPFLSSIAIIEISRLLRDESSHTSSSRSPD